MKLRNISQLIAVTTLTDLSLVACGSNGQEDSSEGVERQAFYQVRGTEVCISREAITDPMTVTFQNGVSLHGNGPFSLDYVQCGKNSEVIRLDVFDEVGYPQLNVRSFIDNQRSEAHSFGDAEISTYAMGSYSVRVERQPDAEETKSFRVWGSRP